MPRYEKSLDLINDEKDLVSGKAQIDYLNELEELCKTCDRVIVHSVIARTAFSHRRFFEKFAARRGFTLAFGIKENSFIMERIADSQLDVTVEQIIKNHKEEVCQKETNNRKAITKLRSLTNR